ALANEGIKSMTSHIWKIAACLLLLTGFTAVGARALPGGEPPAPNAPRAEDAPAPQAPKAEDVPPTKPVTQIKATFIRKQDGKPPMRAFHVKLEMTNPGDKPIWLLLGYYRDLLPSRTGKFTSEAADGQPQCFTGKYFDGEKKGGQGKAIEISYIGGDGFRAFHLPPRSAMTFDDFAIESWSDIKWIDVLEASELRVNGKTPLQEWLPYPTMSDQQVRIPANTDWGNLDWDAKTLKSRTDYPNEKVEFVKPTVLTMRLIPIIGLAPTGPTVFTREWRDGPRMKMADVGAGKLVFSADGKTLLSSAKYPGKVQHWDTTTGQELPLTKQDTSTRYELLGFDRAGEPLGYQILERPAVANTDSALVLVNLRTGERRSAIEFSEPDPKVRRYRLVALSPDESTLAVSEWPDKALLFEVRTAKRLGILAGGDDRLVTAITFAPDGKTLAVAYSANEPTPGERRHEVIAWDWQQRQRRWRTMMNTVTSSLAFSPDGGLLAAGQDAADVPVWNALTGTIRVCPRATPASRRLSHVAFDSQSLAASWQANWKSDPAAGVVFWDAKTWKEQMILMDEPQDVWALAFSPDGAQLAFANTSKVLQIKRAVKLGYQLP
ncbi:MAG: WD40 repeat domain-containing protein, partial [Gemmataceae bacterium]